MGKTYHLLEEPETTCFWTVFFSHFSSPIFPGLELARSCGSANACYTGGARALKVEINEWGLL